jgi:hypothetical protein
MDQTTLLLVLTGVLGLATTWAILQGSNWLKAKAVQWKQMNKFDVLDKYIDIAVNTVVDTVKALNQSVVNDLKEKAADGKLTAEEKTEILNNAVQTVIMSLSEEVQTVLSAVYGDLPTWIATQIDKAVSNEKKPITTVPTGGDTASQTIVVTPTPVNLVVPNNITPVETTPTVINSTPAAATVVETPDTIPGVGEATSNGEA